MSYQFYFWYVTTDRGTVSGTASGVDARDALSRGMTHALDEHILVGEVLGITPNILSAIPANDQGPTEIEVLAEGARVKMRRAGAAERQLVNVTACSVPYWREDRSANPAPRG